MERRLQILGAFFGSFFLVTFAGCGPGHGDLDGRVTFQGKPLRFGTVVVLSEDGIPKSALIKEDGTYAFKDVQAGPVKASVTSMDPGRSLPAQRIPGAPPPKVERTGWFEIPEKYADFAKSELTFSLKSGLNSWNIELK